MKLRDFISLACVLLPCVISSCNKIYRGDQLSTKELEQIRKLGLLDANEKIYQLYSNHQGIKGAGNFYTTKRIANYWLHRGNKQTSFAYYQDIAHINLTTHPPGDFTIPFVTVTRNDSTQFKVYIDGSGSEVKDFFLSCRNHWKSGR
ncbi:MAG TPA: hypothetical protein VFO93_00910 [Hymenobacter sp.]|uniref:hypothetical protein n=1 Tax=Hymenobacter sp. TaxID=1898978 RepID=UPI002D7F88F2|nr:hypothetical protein [Hymenobacter sp.]HET9502069.1 hypothetical protein [Hymenobacter sp.]